MKSIGNVLKEAREARGLSIEQITQDINILQAYLEAMEEERFEVFPAETYLLGFLRVYAEYLGLDLDKTINLYKSYKMGEEPAPLEQLIGVKRGYIPPQRLIKMTALTLGGLLLLGGLFFLGTIAVEAFNNRGRDAVEYSFDDNEAHWELVDGDRILLPYEQGTLIMEISVGEDRLVISSPYWQAPLSLSPGDETILPSKNGLPVLRFHLVGVDNNKAQLSAYRTDVMVDEATQGETALLPPDEGTTAREDETTILSGKTSPEAFSLNVLFSGYSFFRYQRDKEEEVEKFYQEGERIRLDVSNSVVFGYSSGGYVVLRIAGTSVPTGVAGEVAVKSIRWVKKGAYYDLVLSTVW